MSELARRVEEELILDDLLETWLRGRHRSHRCGAAGEASHPQALAEHYYPLRPPA